MLTSNPAPGIFIFRLMAYNFRALEREIKGKREGLFTPLYIYGTEMMEYYKRLGVKNKRVLTVAGSGDQIINAYFYGAWDVVGFDLNKFVKYFVELKFAAIRAFSYREFLRFFGTGKKDASLDYKLYSKIRAKLSRSAGNFFDELYKYFGFNGMKMAQSDFFHQREFRKEPLSRINAYLKNERAYLRTKNLLANKRPFIIQDNVTKIFKNRQLKGKFDLINLSNVPNVFTIHLADKCRDPAMHFYERTLLLLKKILNKHGRIFFYTYDLKGYPNPLAPKIPAISTPEELERLKARKELVLSEIKLTGMFGGKDKVVVLEK